MADKSTVLLGVALVLGIGGCTTMRAAPPASTDPAVSACRARFVDSDRHISTHGTPDAEAARIDGVPHLRVDRLLASFVDEITTTAQRAAWLTRAQELDRRARLVEARNLEVPAIADASALDACRELLHQHDVASASTWAQIRKAVAVPDDYTGWKRVLGLYPLTAALVRAGVERLHARESVTRQPGPGADAIEYGLATTRDPATPALARDALGIAQPTARQLEALFAEHAPRFNVATATVADRIGAVRRDNPTRTVVIDASQPSVYVRTAHTRFEDATLLQLVYAVWFQARPASGRFDLLGGQLDSLIWRVTLDRDGEALIYDVMHGCGCYHMFFPSARLRRRVEKLTDEEPLWVPLAIPSAWPRQLTVYLDAGSHYVTGLGPADPSAPFIAMTSEPMDNLRSLATTSGLRTSLFDRNGLVPSSQRPERFVLWPMGIDSPGAMRQWGHHATAFVGRRHFDEARLIERYFTRR